MKWCPTPLSVFVKMDKKKETENVEENIDKGRRKKQKEEDPPIKKEKTKKRTIKISTYQLT